jgi:branched-chain amino acid transport system substrate-binding protein
LFLLGDIQMNFTFKTIALSAAVVCAGLAFAQAPAKPAVPAKPTAAPAKAAAGPLAGQTVKIALIDPQSGLMFEPAQVVSILR